MSPPNHSIAILGLSLIAVFSGAARLNAQTNKGDTANYAGAVIKEVGITPKFGQQLPLDLEFVDADGKPVRLGDFFNDRPVILHLVYYECPMLCKLSSDGLLSSLSTLSLKPGEDFTIVTLSFDPREGPELSARARELAITRCSAEAVESGWHFLTGDPAAIAAVTDAVGFRYVYDESTRQYAHASGIFVLTPRGTVSRYLGGINYSPRDLRFALVEASDGKVGTTADQVLMLCYMYDPAVGKYGLAIMTVMRVAGLFTVATLATSIAMMIRRERRRNGVINIAGPSWAGSPPSDSMPGQDGRAI